MEWFLSMRLTSFPHLDTYWCDGPKPVSGVLICSKKTYRVIGRERLSKYIGVHVTNWWLSQCSWWVRAVVGCWTLCVGCFVCLNLALPLWYQLSLLVRLLLMATVVVLARFVLQCSGFSCSAWLLKYFAMDTEVVGCSSLFMFGDWV